ncbi:MAG: SPOR domain-containing protein [Ignavibacteriales bacterium]|nr:SPOR domain-containing protein [Ignavibacteriales bacterium]
MNMRLCVVLLMAAALFFAGCKTTEHTRQQEQPPVTETQRKAPLSQYEATFNPTDYDEDVAQVQKSHITENRINGDQSTADSTIIESEFHQGFRIQIFASVNIDEANAMKIAAAPKITEDSVYVVFDPPVYKVRVGDYRRRMEASQKLPKFIEMGFPDAWVVGDQIIQRKIIRIKAGEKLKKEN